MRTQSKDVTAQHGRFMSQQERVIVVLNDACLLGLPFSHEAGEIPSTSIVPA